MKRIQRRRTRGFKMPENAIYVGRPSKWGNNYPIGFYGREQAIKRYQNFLMGLSPEELRKFLEPLAGKDLACWCPLSLPCHADLLIEYCERAGLTQESKMIDSTGKITSTQEC